MSYYAFIEGATFACKPPYKMAMISSSLKILRRGFGKFLMITSISLKLNSRSVLMLVGFVP